jgi:hypothetical protein
MSLSDQLPTFRRLGSSLGATFRRVAPTLWKWSLRAFFVLVCLVTLLALVIAEENFRTQRALDNYQQAAQARGIALTFSELSPPPVSDDQNFAMSPLLRLMYEPSGGKSKQAAQDKKALWATLDLPSDASGIQPRYGDWQSGQRFDVKAWAAYLGQPGVIAALKRYEAPLAEISAVSRRPYSRFPINYDNQPNFFLNIQTIIELVNVYQFRAYAEFSTGQTEAAAQDTITLLRVANAGEAEPVMLSALTRVGALNRPLAVLWQGLAAHCWSDSQLSALQAELQQIDLFPQLPRALNGNCIFFAGGMEQFMALDFTKRLDQLQKALFYKRSTSSLSLGLSIAPRFVFNQACLTCDHYYDQFVLPSINVAQRRFNPAIFKDGDAEFARLTQPSFFRPVSYLLHMFMFSPTYSIGMVICAQTFLDEASVACALERFRLAHGAYPDSLDALVPQFIAQLPHDVISGGPLHYQRTADGRFLLYSVGWNETDDHGLVIKDPNGGIDYYQGDWVWPNPAPKSHSPF